MRVRASFTIDLRARGRSVPSSEDAVRSDCKCGCKGLTPGSLQLAPLALGESRPSRKKPNETLSTKLRWQATSRVHSCKIAMGETEVHDG
jgi:hypothetical protein